VSLDAAGRESVLERLRFYRELGLTEFYRRPLDPALLAQWEAARADAESTAAPAATSTVLPAGLSAAHTAQQTLLSPFAPAGNAMQSAPEPAQPDFSAPQPAFSMEGDPIPPRKPLSAPPAVAAAVPPAQRAAALQSIRDEIGPCTRCALHTGRNQLVFGDGDPLARLMFVGEGPGADEDAQGLPFVGKAGQLLNNMIGAMGLRRDQVYIANVVKCRPPGNRVPEPEEAGTCTPFLFRQIDVIRPEVLVALGATAATWLLGQRQPLAGLRGRIHSVRGCRLIVTYHPAYLLRDPRQKKEAWADLQIAMRELGLNPPGKG
jgi:DNA polymerase